MADSFRANRTLIQGGLATLARAPTIVAHARRPGPELTGTPPPARPHDTVLGDAGGPAAKLPAVGDVVDGRYRLDLKIGGGAFGTVFRASRLDVPEHRVALKVVDIRAYSVRDAIRELEMLSAVAHPNVVQLADHGVTATHVWFTMPFMEGRTLGARLAGGQFLDVEEAHAIFLPVARGLAALHKAGLRHQDVKPDNVFLASLDGTEHPVILDLGAAVESHHAFVAGTPTFCAPEALAVLWGAPTTPPSAKVDVYSFAVTLLTAIGADPATQELSDSELPMDEFLTRLDAIHEVRHSPRPIARGRLRVSSSTLDALNACAARWLAPDPDARPTMEEVVRDLDVLLAEKRRRERRRDVVRTAAWVALAGAAIAAGARVWLLRQEGITTARVRTCLAALSQTEGDVQTCEGQLATHVRAEAECSTRERACGVALGAAGDATRRCEGEVAAKVSALGALAAKRKECDDAREQGRIERTTLEATLATRTGERDAARTELDLARKEALDAKARLDSCSTQLGGALKAEAACESSRAQAESGRIAAESELAKGRGELAKSAADLVDCRKAESTSRADASHLRGELAQCESALALVPTAKPPVKPATRR